MGARLLTYLGIGDCLQEGGLVAHEVGCKICAKRLEGLKSEFVI